MYAVILCGGSGTRLWPLSRKNYPKQFLSLYSDKSLLQETFLRISKIIPKKNIFFVANNEDFYNVFNQIKDIYPKFSKKQFLAEPKKRNTAPAIAYAMMYLQEKMGVKKNEQVIFLPADHYIGKEKKYLNLIKKALKQNDNHIGTIGITPTAPETGYGYIKKETIGKNKTVSKGRKTEKKQEEYYKVEEFKEKPDKKIAKKYLQSGNYVWNAGMYIFNYQTFATELKKYAPKIFNLFKKDLKFLLDNFEKMPSISVDYAISEKSKKVIVFEGEFGWSDIGSFDSLAKLLVKKKDKDPNHIKVDSKNVFIHSTSNKLIATMGVRDLIVIENNDSILIQKKGKSEEVKQIVNFLKENKRKEINDNVIVHRPWGKFEVLIDGTRHAVRKVTIYPGGEIKTQLHYHRAEHWIIIKGTAKIKNGNKIFYLNSNESTFIPQATKHQIINPGKVNLEMIEVQTGNYLGRDDIVIFDK